VMKICRKISDRKNIPNFGVIIMKASVTEDCVACELCVETCPEVFQMGEEFAKVIVDEVPEGHEDAVEEAADLCPTEAIIIKT